jgi:hypothetical protein
MPRLFFLPAVYVVEWRIFGFLGTRFYSYCIFEHTESRREDSRDYSVSRVDQGQEEMYLLEVFTYSTFPTSYLSR